jgi:hypothetical protein
MLKYCASFQLFDNLPKDRLLSEYDWPMYEKLKNGALAREEQIWGDEAQ